MFSETFLATQQLERKVKSINDEIIQANQKLRDLYFSFNDFKTRGQLRLEKRIVSSGKQHYDFDLNAQEYFYEKFQHIHLERPEIQEQFNNTFIQLLQQEIRPASHEFYADQAAKEIKKWLQPQNSHKQVKMQLLSLFKRQLANLKLKKIRTIQRYSQIVDNTKQLYFRSRINLIDFEISSLIKRRERLKSDESFEEAFNSIGSRPRQVQQSQVSMQEKIIEDEELCYSNISKDDIQVYFRIVMFTNLCSRKMMYCLVKIKKIFRKFLRRVRWVHSEFRFDIIKESVAYINEMKLRNIEKNFEEFKFIQDQMDQITGNRFPQTPEIKLLCQELLEKIKFNLGEEKEFHSLAERFDSLPLLPFYDFQTTQNFYRSCEFFLNKSSLENIGIPALLFRINNIISLLYTYQNRQFEFLISSPNEPLQSLNEIQNMLSKQSNRISDLTALEEAQLKSYLKREIRPKVDIIKINQDWIKMLKFTQRHDRFQLITMNMMNDVIQDAQTKLIIQLVGLSDEESTRKYIAQNANETLLQSPNRLFAIVENKAYIEQSHLQISLEQLNELFYMTNNNNKPGEERFQVKQKIKPEHLKCLEEIFNDLRPSQNLIEITNMMDLLAMREQRKQTFDILNALRSIERRITYDLISILDCKVIKDLDLELILSVSEQKVQQERLNQIKQQSIFSNIDFSTFNKAQHIKQRPNMISFIDGKKKMDERFIQSLKSDVSIGRMDRIRYGDRDGRGSDIFVLSNQNEGLAEKEICYDIVEQDLKDVELRLCSTASFYLNKYEKINRIVHSMGLLVNRFALLKSLWLNEREYQYQRLRLIDSYIQLYENLTDPVECYKIAVKILNLMKQIPLLDMDSYNFENSYQINIQEMKVQEQLIRKLSVIQQQEEEKEVQRVYQKVNILGQVDVETVEASINQDRFQSEKKKATIDLKSKSKPTDIEISGTEAVEQQQFDTIQDQKFQEDPFYESYMLEKNMDEVFAELSQNRQVNHGDDGSSNNQTNLPNKKIPQHFQQLGQYLIHPETQLKLRFEGYPHFTYPKEPINFYNSLMLVRYVIEKGEECFLKLTERFPQKSLLFILSIKQSLWKKIYDILLEEKDTNIGKLEDRELFDDEITLMQSMSNFSEQVMQQLLDYQTTQKTDSTFESQKSTLGKDWNLPSKMKESLINYDQSTLDSFLLHKRAPYLHIYRGLFIACNLIEFYRMREELILTLVEIKTLNKIYKKQRGLLGIKVHKYKELYSKESANFKHQFQFKQDDGTIEHHLANSFIKKSKILKSAYFYEVDETILPLINFETQNDVVIFGLQDILEEFRTILLYELSNMELIAHNCMLWERRWDNLTHVSMELDILINNKVFCENHYLDIDRVFQNVENFKKMKKSIDQIATSTLQDKVQDNPKDKKQLILSLAERKYHDSHAYLMTSNQGSTTLASLLICQKRIKNVKLMLIRLAIEDLIKEICIDAHKLHLMHVCGGIRRFAQALPIFHNVFTVSNEVIPEEIEKKLYNDQKKTLIRNAQKSVKYLCGTQMNVLNPFYIMGVEDIVRFINDNRETTTSNHIFKIDPSIVGYLQSFYNFQKKPRRNTNDPNSTEQTANQINAFYSYIEEMYNYISGESEKPIITQWSLNSKSYPVVRLLKYYMNLHNFLKTQFLDTQTKLEPSEISIIIEMMIMNSVWNDDEALLKKKNLQPQKRRESLLIQESFKNKMADLGLKEENKALMSYEEKVIELNNDNLHIANPKKRVILHEAIDNIVQRVKNNMQIQEAFASLQAQLTYIAKYSTDNFFILEELSKFFKMRARISYKEFLLALNETVVQSTERNPQSTMTQHYFNIYNILYSNFHPNELNLKFFNTEFYSLQQGMFEHSDKHPFYKSREFRRFSHKSSKGLNSLQQILKYTPTNLKKFLFNIDKKAHLMKAQTLEDYNLTSQSTLFNRSKIISRAKKPDRGIYFQDYSVVNCSYWMQQLNPFERRTMQANIRHIEEISFAFAQLKQSKQELNFFDSKDIQNQYIEKICEVFNARQALLLIKWPVEFPIFSQEYLRYMSEIKSDLQHKVTSLKMLAPKSFDIIKVLFNKQDHKFLEVFNENKNQVYQGRVMSSIIDVLLERELAHKKIYLELAYMGVNSMQAEIEMISTFRSLNQNLQERHRNYALKQKMTQKLALGNNLMLPRVKNNPCFSSNLQRESKQTNMIPSQLKMSFLQAFINRLRNKVSRVDLLSSGSGFVITINDLEDCVNYLHRSLYQFSEKELRARLETCALIFDYQQQQINSKDKQIQSLKLQINQLTEIIQKNTEGVIIQKGNQLLYDFEAINRKLKDFTLYTAGLEEILKEQIRREFEWENLSLNNEKEVLKQKFDDFKAELLVLCKTQIRKNVTFLEKFIKDKVFEALQSQPDKLLFDEVKDKQSLLLDEMEKSLTMQKKTEQQTDLQYLSFLEQKDQLKWKKCAPDEDVIFDPYVTTKWINKIRSFYLLKIGMIKLKHQEQIKQLNTKIKNVEEISQKITDFQKREIILKKELVNLHELLSQQKKINESLSQELETITFENKRLQKINEDCQQQIKSLKNLNSIEKIEPKRFLSLESREDAKFPQIVNNVKKKNQLYSTGKKVKLKDLSFNIEENKFN